MPVGKHFSAVIPHTRAILFYMPMVDSRNRLGFDVRSITIFRKTIYQFRVQMKLSGTALSTEFEYPKSQASGPWDGSLAKVLAAKPSWLGPWEPHGGENQIL